MAEAPDTKLLVHDAIVEMVTSHWKQHRKAVLLAYVGQLLTRQMRTEFKRALNGEKLVSFVEENLSDKLRIVRSPTDPLVVAAVPADVIPEEDLFAASFPVKVNSPSSVRYENKAWTAFWRPLAPDHKRYLSLVPYVSFVDLPANEVAPENATEIERRFIYDGPVSTPEQKAEAVARLLIEWCTHHTIDPTQLERRRSQKTEASYSALAVVLKALSPSDLQRISLPLDIVKKLLDTPGR